MVDLSESIWNLALLPLQTSYLYYHNDYVHKTWQDGDLHEVLLHIELLNLWLRDLARSRDKLLPLYVQYCRVYGQQTWHDGDLP